MLPATTIEATDLPEDVFALLDAHLVSLGGTYADPEAGDPIQYDHLRIEHGPGAVEVTVYNQAIPLFMTEREAVRRIHQVCCRPSRPSQFGLRRGRILERRAG